MQSVNCTVFSGQEWKNFKGGTIMYAVCNTKQFLNILLLDIIGKPKNIVLFKYFLLVFVENQ